MSRYILIINNDDLPTISQLLSWLICTSCKCNGYRSCEYMPKKLKQTTKFSIKKWRLTNLHMGCAPGMLDLPYCWVWDFLSRQFWRMTTACKPAGWETGRVVVAPVLAPSLALATFSTCRWKPEPSELELCPCHVSSRGRRRLPLPKCRRRAPGQPATTTAGAGPHSAANQRMSCGNSGIPKDEMTKKPMIRTQPRSNFRLAGMISKAPAGSEDDLKWDSDNNTPKQCCE